MCCKELFQKPIRGASAVTTWRRKSRWRCVRRFLTNERIAQHMLCCRVSQPKHPSAVPELRRPVSHRWCAHRLASTTHTAACYLACFLFCFFVVFILSLTSIVPVHHIAVCLCPQRQNLANRQCWEAQQARPPLPITPPRDGQADRRVPAQSHRFDFLSCIKFVTFLNDVNRGGVVPSFIQTKNCSLS